ncbi:MAG: hypothetical protein V4654_12635 [Bdellovibrionota bacterium]
MHINNLFDWPSKKVNFCIFLFAFTFAIACMLTAREIIIPRMNWNGVDGHLAGDPQLYHKVANQKAEEMRRDGLSAFELRPDSSGPAGIASLVYLFFDSVYGVVVVNAMLHALSVLLCYLILSNWFSPKFSLLGAIPLFLSPYQMIWFSQINKDSYAVTSALLVIYGALELIKKATQNLDKSNYVLGVVTICSGSVLAGLVRPYLNQINFVVLLLVFLTPLFLRKIKNWKIYLPVIFLVLFVIKVQSTGATSDKTIDSFKNFVWSPEITQSLTQSETQSSEKSLSVVDKCYISVSVGTWQNDFFVGYVNDKIRGLIGQRCNMFTYLYSQKDVPNTIDSIVDYDILPSSTTQAFAYFPRAASYGIFAPWPSDWLFIFKKRFSFIYMIAPVEAFCLYLGLLFLLYWIYTEKQFLAIVPIFISFSVMGIYGLSTPFLGSLYRFRYAWWMLLIGLGIGALLTVLQKKKKSI